KRTSWRWMQTLANESRRQKVPLATGSHDYVAVPVYGELVSAGRTGNQFDRRGNWGRGTGNGERALLRPFQGPGRSLNRAQERMAFQSKMSANHADSGASACEAREACRPLPHAAMHIFVAAKSRRKLANRYFKLDSRSFREVASRQ